MCEGNGGLICGGLYMGGGLTDGEIWYIPYTSTVLTANCNNIEMFGSPYSL